MKDAIDNERTTDEDALQSGENQERDDSWDYWNPLTITSSIYCIITFVCSAALFSGSGIWFFCVVAAVFFAMAQLTSIYAALGPESYWKRLLITQASFMFCGLSLIGGAALGQRNGLGREFPDGVTIAVIASSMAGQLMYGFLRMVANWRFHLQGMPRGPIYDLKDMFALMTYLAVSLAVLNLLSPNGVVETVPAIIMSFIAVGIATLAYGVPTLITTFSSRASEQGCLSQLIIVVALGFLIVMPFAAMGAQMITLPVLFFLCACALFTWIPLVQMRNKGIVLTKRPEKTSGS